MLNRIFILYPKLCLFLSIDILHVAYLFVSNKGWNRKILYVSLIERFGDIVSAEPIFRKIHSDHEHCKIVWIVGRRFKSLAKCYKSHQYIVSIHFFDEWIILKHLLPKSNVIDLNLDQKEGGVTGLKLKNKNSIGLNVHNYYAFGNLLHAFGQNYTVDTNLAPVFNVEENAMPIGPTDKKYVVIHTISDEKSRNWEATEWDNLIRYLDKLKIPTFEIGLKSGLPNNPILNNAIGLSIEQTASIIKKASLFIGIDSGPAHLANAVGTYGFILLGKYKEFNSYMPYSGDYQNGKNATIFQHNKSLNKLEFQEIKPLLDSVLTKLDLKNA